MTDRPPAGGLPRPQAPTPHVTLLTEAEEEALRARKIFVAAANRRFGKGLSIAGVSLLVLCLVMLFGGGLALTWVDQAAKTGHDPDVVSSVRGIAAVCLTALPAIVLLFAVCCVIPGEQMRRGWIAPTSKPQKGLLPTASMVSEFSILGIGWHVLWSSAGLLVTAALIGIPMASWFTGAWPATLSEDNEFGAFWMIYGTFALGITIASFTSLIKKVAYVRQYRIRGEAISAGGPGKSFWRWVDFRWRLDLWLAGAGGVLLGLSPTFLSEAVGPYGSPEELAAALPGAVRLAALGILLVIVGVAASLNFWRAGEPLGSGESAA